MKPKTNTSPSSAARLLLVTCTTIASSLLLAGKASATHHHHHQTESTCQIPTDTTLTVAKDGSETIHSFVCRNITFHENASLVIDGGLVVKNISCDAPNAKIILCPDAIIDLAGSTLIASSLTLADGTEIINETYSFNDGDNTLVPKSLDELNAIPSFKLSNGARLVHGALIIDSTRANAVHLVERADTSKKDQTPDSSTSQPALVAAPVNADKESTPAPAAPADKTPDVVAAQPEPVVAPVNADKESTPAPAAPADKTPDVVAAQPEPVAAPVNADKESTPAPAAPADKTPDVVAAQPEPVAAPVKKHKKRTPAPSAPVNQAPDSSSNDQSIVSSGEAINPASSLIPDSQN